MQFNNSFIYFIFYVHSVHFYLLTFIICTNKCTHTYTYIVQNYITNAPTYFGASAPSSGSLYIVFAKVIKY